MGHEIHLHKAGGGDVPVFGFDGDEVFEQGAGLRAAIQTAQELALVVLEAAIKSF